MTTTPEAIDSVRTYIAFVEQHCASALHLFRGQPTDRALLPQSPGLFYKGVRVALVQVLAIVTKVEAQAWLGEEGVADEGGGASQG